MPRHRSYGQADRPDGRREAETDHPHPGEEHPADDDHEALGIRHLRGRDRELAECDRAEDQQRTDGEDGQRVVLVGIGRRPGTARSDLRDDQAEWQEHHQRCEATERLGRLGPDDDRRHRRREGQCDPSGPEPGHRHVAAGPRPRQPLRAPEPWLPWHAVRPATPRTAWVGAPVVAALTGSPGCVRAHGDLPRDMTGL